MKKLKKIVFFFPWKEISGGPIYFSNLANDLSKYDGYEVWYVDYSPGLSDNLLNDKIKKLKYCEPFRFPQLGPITIITPIYCAMHIPNIDENSNIVFVNWHNFCTQATVNMWRLSAKELQKFLSLINKNDALFFLDKSHWLAQNKYVARGKEFKEKYVPVKYQTVEQKSLEYLVHAFEINITILGRLSRDKVHGVINVLEQLERSKISWKKNIYIVGEGEMRDAISTRIWKNDIQVIMMGTMVGNKLMDHLSKHTDILFAMGTSALIGASISLPTVIFPHNIIPFSINAFTWAFECKGYAMGWYDEQIEELEIPTHSIDDIIKEIYIYNKKDDYGKECFNYIKTYHSENISKFIKCINDTTLTYREFRKFARKQGYIKIGIMPIARIICSFDGLERSVSLFGQGKILQYKVNRGKKEFLLFGRPQKWIIAIKENDVMRIYVRIPFIKA